MTRRSVPVVRARYLGPTEARGSRIQVTWQGRRTRVPFSHAARDAFVHAVEQVTGLPESRLAREDYRDSDNRVYLVLPEDG